MPQSQSPEPAALVEIATEVADRLLAPLAGAVDREEASAADNLRILAEAGLLGLTVPAAYGGVGATVGTVRDCLALLASGCGTTAFVLFQHLGFCGQIARGENEALKAGLLPALAAGRAFGTLAFSHLRRPDSPVTVVESANGCVFHGRGPWATGWGLADELLLAGTLPDGRFLWAVTPARESEALLVSAPMRLCAASASHTVSLTLRGLFVPREQYVRTSTREQLMADTHTGMLTHCMLSLGATRASVRLLREQGAARSLAFVEAAAATLEAEAERARTRVHHLAGNAEAADHGDQVLQVRSRCIDLGVRATHAAVVATGGAANSLEHPAQRLYREALLYSVTALTPDLQRDTLKRLLQPYEVPG